MSSSSWAGAAAAGLPPPPPPDSSLGWSGFLPPGADFGQDYVGFRFPKNPQPLQEAGTILAEDSPSSSSGGTGSTTEEVAGEMPAQKGNRKALCKFWVVLFFFSPSCLSLEPFCPPPPGGQKGLKKTQNKQKT